MSVTTRPAVEPATPRVNPPREAATHRRKDERPATHDHPTTPDRRLVLARAIVRTLRAALIDPATLDLVLDEGRPRRPSAGASGPQATIVIRGPDALGRLLRRPTTDGFAEGFLRGDLDIEGDIAVAIGAGQTFDLRRLNSQDARRIARWGWQLWRGTPNATGLVRASQVSGRRHSRARDMQAIRFHYDVGDEFFALWLDRRRTYTCAYFPDGTTVATAADRLDAAQEAKLDLIARKLRLGPDDRLLDIGSGWGSLINFVGQRYGSRAIGVTLSEGQVAEANAAAQAAGMSDRVRAEIRDYRDLAGLGEFDRVASVGMFEHVGRANLPTYFRAAFDALRPGGLFLNHGLASQRGRGSRLVPDRRPTAARFLQRYVFPDGELVPLEEAVEVARAAGFEVLDIQSLRPHYALTLAAWVTRLEARWDEAVALTSEEVARTWRLYMAASRLGFEQGELDIFQMLLAKPVDGRPAPMPLRPWWWADRRRPVAVPVVGSASGT